MSTNRMTKAELVALLAQRNSELEAARERISVLEASVPRKPSNPAPSALIAAQRNKVVYEWNPSVPGDFAAKSQLVRQFGGTLRRVQEQRA